MGFENPFKKKTAPAMTIEERTAEQDKRQNQQLVGAAILGVGAIGIGQAINEQTPDLNQMHAPTPATAPAAHENPTLGMKSTDRPQAFVISAPEASNQQQSVVTPEGAGEPVVINLAEKQVVVENPER